MYVNEIARMLKLSWGTFYVRRKTYEHGRIAFILEWRNYGMTQRISEVVQQDTKTPAKKKPLCFPSERP